VVGAEHSEELRPDRCYGQGLVQLLAEESAAWEEVCWANISETFTEEINVVATKMGVTEKRCTITDVPTIPLMYQGFIFGYDYTLNPREQLFPSTSLKWFWCSQRSPSSSHGRLSHTSPVVRRLTELRESTSNDFVRDHLEIDEGANYRAVCLVGLDKDGESAVLNGERFKQALTVFATREEAPIRFVSFSDGDSEQCIFVNHRPPAEISNLLVRWGISPSMPAVEVVRRNSSKFGLLNLVDNVVDMAFPKNS